MALVMTRHVGLPDGLQSLIQTELFFAAAWFIGDSVRIRGLYTRTLEEKAALLEREREERARLAILEERERIARELHDAVTHHVSVMVIQAGGALRALDRRPEDARTALEAIDSTARQALTDMRRMLGILGGETQGPPPRLDRLGDLVEQVRTAGLAVELSVQGEPRELEAGLELSAYRIIQEGLTNSLRHAGGGRARVTVRYGRSSLELSIDDERGPGAPPAMEPEHEGRGLVGMRERVAMFRGRFSAHPTASGFRVTAALPLDEAVSPS
jgi:signal transduction histidine kinase